jgi:predicted 2-oxoglutarate/Fe(II)-dependent dioxygenase YbiX
MIPNLEKPAICWDINKKIYKKHNAVPIELCEEIISYGEKNVRKGENKYPKAFKNSFHAALLPLNHKVHSALDNVWDEIIKHFNIDLTFVEPYELKRYTDADFFGSHIDNYYGLTTDIDRKITMVIQLSDEQSYKCGELKIIDISAPKNRGSVVAFPSFFRHEVLRTIGTRWSLIGWAWGPYWK